MFKKREKIVLLVILRSVVVSGSYLHKLRLVFLLGSVDS